MSKKTAVISAGLIALLCAALIIGSTFALFAVNRSSEIAVTTGSVDISAELSNLSTASLSPDAENVPNNPAGTFATGGTAALDGETGRITLTNVIPGDSATFTLTVTNTGNNAAKVRVDVAKTVDKGAENAADELLVTVKNGDADFATGVWTCGADNGALVLNPEDTLVLTVTVALDKDATQPVNDITGAVEQLISSATVKITIYAGQANASDGDLNGALGLGA